MTLEELQKKLEDYGNIISKITESISKLSQIGFDPEFDSQLAQLIDSDIAKKSKIFGEEKIKK